MLRPGKYFLFIVFVALCFPKNCFSAKENIDSLYQVLDELNKKTAGRPAELADTTKARVLNIIAMAIYNKGDYEKAMDLALQAKMIVQNIILNNKQSSHGRTLKMILATSYNSIGMVYKLKGNNIMAREQFTRSLALRQEINDLKGIAACFNNLAIICNEQGNYSKALELNLKSLKLREELKDEKGIASNYNNIGIIYQSMLDLKKALEYFNKSLEINVRLGNKITEGRNLNNIGQIYDQMNNDSLAIVFYKRSLALRRSIGDKQGIASSLSNLARTFTKSKQFDKAEELNLEAIKVADEIGDRLTLAHGCLSLGENYVLQMKENPALIPRCASKARSYTERAMKVSTEMGDKKLMSGCYRVGGDIEEAMGNYMKAYSHFSLYITYRDSLLNGENTKKVVQAEMNYEYAKKETLEKLEREKKEASERRERAKEKNIRNIAIAAFSFMLLLAVFSYLGFRNKQRANLLISAQKKEVEAQKHLVDQRQKQIIDSINYARRIQQSILIDESELKKFHEHSFILYRPKEIVSGDFYWFDRNEQSGNELIFAVADCTGQGVPGAFLSMIGSTLLNEIVNHNKITDPAGVLKQLSAGIKSALKSKEKEDILTEGMDISICFVDRRKRKIYFAGANQSVYLAGKEFKKINGQISADIGVLSVDKTSSFNSIEINPQEGDMIYLFTDGYTRQPGGADNRGLNDEELQEILAVIYGLPVEEQKKELEKKFNDWKGNNIQEDDILVIGFRI